MLTSLTDEQKKIIDDIKNGFISPLHRKINEVHAKDSIETIYRSCGLSKPTIYIVDSPMAAQKKIKFLDKNVIYKIRQENIRKRIEDFVTRQEIIIRKQIVGLVDENIRELFRDNSDYCRRFIYLERIYNRVNDQISRCKTLHFHMYCEMIRYIPWLLFYLHFKKLGILENELFDAYYKYAQSGIFANVYFDDSDIVVLIKNPLYVASDNRGRLSNKDGYAIEWPDGYGMYFVNNVHFNRELYNSIFIEKTIKGKDILLLKNTEQKAVAIQQYGYYDMIKDIGAKKIDEMEITTKVGKAVNELYDFEIEGKEDWRRIRGRFVKVVDHSTGKITCLGIPIEKNTETVRGAIAWTFGLNEMEYKPVIET